MLISTPGVALAKTTFRNGHTYRSWRNCSYVATWLSDEGGNPRLQSQGTMDWTDGFSECGNIHYVADPLAIALRQNLMFWADGQQGGGWIICDTAAPWVQNNGPAHEVFTGFSWARPPCGPAFYRSWGNTMTWDAPTGGWKTWGPLFATTGSSLSNTPGVLGPSLPLPPPTAQIRASTAAWRRSMTGSPLSTRMHRSTAAGGRRIIKVHRASSYADDGRRSSPPPPARRRHQ